MNHADPFESQDLSLLDRPDILSVMFYPQRDRTRPPAGATDLMVDVAPSVQVHCRWHPLTVAAPAVLFFHGNGEVAADYDGIAPLYHRAGLSLLVADYRGYGQSDGSPSFGAMLADALTLCDAFHTTLDEAGVTGPRFLMGRSLGALSAVEIAARRPNRLRGLVLESGAAGVRGWSRFTRPGDPADAWQSLHDLQIAKLRAVSLPLLTIHGEWDELIPLATALDVYETIGSTAKQLEVIPRAGHNDLLAVGLDPYFAALARFVTAHSA